MCVCTGCLDGWTDARIDQIDTSVDIYIYIYMCVCMYACMLMLACNPPPSRTSRTDLNHVIVDVRLCVATNGSRTP